MRKDNSVKSGLPVLLIDRPAAFDTLEIWQSLLVELERGPRTRTSSCSPPCKWSRKNPRSGPQPTAGASPGIEKIPTLVAVRAINPKGNYVRAGSVNRELQPRRRVRTGLNRRADLAVQMGRLHCHGRRTVKKHQRHEAAPDQEREEGPETKCDPAVLVHLDAAGVVPHRHSLERRED